MICPASRVLTRPSLTVPLCGSPRTRQTRERADLIIPIWQSQAPGCILPWEFLWTQKASGGVLSSLPCLSRDLSKKPPRAPFGTLRMYPWTMPLDKFGGRLWESLRREPTAKQPGKATSDYPYLSAPDYSPTRASAQESEQVLERFRGLPVLFWLVDHVASTGLRQKVLGIGGLGL